MRSYEQGEHVLIGGSVPDETREKSAKKDSFYKKLARMEERMEIRFRRSKHEEGDAPTTSTILSTVNQVNRNYRRDVRIEWRDGYALLYEAK